MSSRVEASQVWTHIKNKCLQIIVWCLPPGKEGWAKDEDSKGGNIW